MFVSESKLPSASSLRASQQPERLLTTHRAQRFKQLESQGKSPETIKDLAKDAQRLAGLRLSLTSQISQARKFIEDNKMMKDDPDGNRQSVLKFLAEDFESGIKTKLDELEQMARDLLQIVSKPVYAFMQKMYAN